MESKPDPTHSGGDGLIAVGNFVTSSKTALSSANVTRSPRINSRRWRAFRNVAILMLGVSRCSTCGEVLYPGQAMVDITHFIGDPADPHSRFSETGMYAKCFAGWEHRDEFAARYHAALGRTLGGSVPAVLANPDGPPLLKSRLSVLGMKEERAGYYEALPTRIARVV